MLLFGHFRCGNIGFVPVKSATVIGARCHTIPATDAPVIVHDDNSVWLFPGGLGGAGLDTRGSFTVETLNPHIEMVLNRHFMEVFSVADLRRHLTVFHLKNTNILRIRLAVEVVLLDAGSHAFQVTFTAGETKGIAK
jgi:hypothetical protein